jgi:hypothetical protein
MWTDLGCNTAHLLASWKYLISRWREIGIGHKPQS